MPRRRSCCCISLRVCLYGLGITLLLLLSIIVVIAYAAIFHIILPGRRAFYLETAYLKAFNYADFSDSINAVLAPHLNGSRIAHQPRVQRLIQDVPQLHLWQVGQNSGPMDAAFGGTWTKLWYESLGITPAGFGSYCNRGKEFWVYLGGTHEDPAETKASKNETEEKKPDPIVFQHPYRQHACSEDPKYICDMYNSAFNRIAERWHTRSKNNSRTSKAQLRFIDCDVSPFLCQDFFFGLAANPVMLLHLKIEEDGCTFNHDIGDKLCPTTWRFIGLPQWKAPWTRRIRIPLDNGGSTVVPAFPSVEEQLWSLMAQDGAYNALEYGLGNESSSNWNIISTVSPDVGLDETFFHEVGIFRMGYLHMYLQLAALDDPPDWYLRISEATYWVDRFLVWWDGRPDVVRPVPTDVIAKELETARGLNKAWQNVQKKEDEWWEKIGIPRPSSDDWDEDWDDDEEEDWEENWAEDGYQRTQNLKTMFDEYKSSR